MSDVEASRITTERVVEAIVWRLREIADHLDPGVPTESEGPWIADAFGREVAAILEIAGRDGGAAPRPPY